MGIGLVPILLGQVQMYSPDKPLFLRVMICGAASEMLPKATEHLQFEHLASFAAVAPQATHK